MLIQQTRPYLSLYKKFTHMDNTILEQSNIKPTAVRRLVLDALHKAECALSLTDLEARLGTVDKSSIFRTLTLFLSHHLIHGIEDGSGQLKYALCPPQCHCGEDEHCGLDDLHTHFRCQRCGKTFCLRGLPVPSVPLPKGFELTSANYVLVGYCPECAGKHH